LQPQREPCGFLRAEAFLSGGLKFMKASDELPNIALAHNIMAFDSTSTRSLSRRSIRAKACARGLSRRGVVMLGVILPVVRQ
jgi:hypothetical protein